MEKRSDTSSSLSCKPAQSDRSNALTYATRAWTPLMKNTALPTDDEEFANYMRDPVLETGVEDPEGKVAPGDYLLTPDVKQSVDRVTQLFRKASRLNKRILEEHAYLEHALKQAARDREATRAGWSEADAVRLRELNGVVAESTSAAGSGTSSDIASECGSDDGGCVDGVSRTEPAGLVKSNVPASMEGRVVVADNAATMTTTSDATEAVTTSTDAHAGESDEVTGLLDALAAGASVAVLFNR